MQPSSNHTQSPQTKAHIIAITNQKGGVGKTTTAINFSASLAAAGYRVLLVDFDPQGNASSGVGYSSNRVQMSIYDAIVNESALKDCVYSTEIPTLFLVPATIDLVGAEIEIITTDQREYVLSQKLESVRDQYDYIVIDCPPALGILTLNALVAADSIVVPMQAEYFALEGLSALMKTVTNIQQKYNPRLHIDGVIFCMCDDRTNLSKQVQHEVQTHLGHHVFSTRIPRNVRLSEAPSHGKPILLYDLHSTGCKGYFKFAQEYIEKQQR